MLAFIDSFSNFKNCSIHTGRLNNSAPCMEVDSSSNDWVSISLK